MKILFPSDPIWPEEVDGRPRLFRLDGVALIVEDDAGVMLISSFDLLGRHIDTLSEPFASPPTCP